eukprot:403340704
MTWLYKGAYSCAYELGLEQQTFGFLSYPIKMLKLVQYYGIKPICVFDGMPLDAKMETEQGRKDSKKTNKDLALRFAREGKVEEAKKHFMRSLQLRSKMIDLLMDVLKVLDIEFIKAPYEADAQIAYLVREGIADIAISEDSDLIAFGCPRLLMKLDFRGICQVFDADDFIQNNKITDASLKFLQKANRKQFVSICIMGGCDYLPSIQKVGLKIAVKFFQKHETIEKVIEAMRANSTYTQNVPFNYVEALLKVQTLFFYQTVFNPRTNKFTSLENIPEEDQDIDKNFLGKYIEENLIDDYVQGHFKKGNQEKRESYGHVLDLKRLLDDYHANNLSDRSFICLDPTFFKNTQPPQRRHAYQPRDMTQQQQQQLPLINASSEIRRQEEMLEQPLDIEELLLQGELLSVGRSNTDTTSSNRLSQNNLGTVEFELEQTNTPSCEDQPIKIATNKIIKNDIALIENLCKSINQAKSKQVSSSCPEFIDQSANYINKDTSQSIDDQDLETAADRTYEQQKIISHQPASLQSPHKFKNPFAKQPNSQPLTKSSQTTKRLQDSFKSFDKVKEFFEAEERKQHLLELQIQSATQHQNGQTDLTIYMQQMHEVVNDEAVEKVKRTRKRKHHEKEETKTKNAKIGDFFAKRQKKEEVQQGSTAGSQENNQSEEMECQQ